jgi:hypothetical protein
MCRARAAVFAGALVFGPACSSNETPNKPSDPAPVSPSTPAVMVTSAQLQAGAAMVDRAVAALGGAQAIDAVTSLSVSGAMTRPLPNGRETSASVVTSVKFPGSYRQELTMAPGKLTTVIGPRGGWILTGNEAPLPLPDNRRLEIENIILRNPVALLKARSSELFVATAITDVLEIHVGSKASRVRLDDRGRIASVSYQLPGPKDTAPPSVTVHYGDYRQAEGIVYPFESRAESAGAVMYRVQLDSVKVNEQLPDRLFVPPASIRK